MPTNNDLWRVDVAGYACYVKGKHAADHLERVNGSLARMKMALHRIAKAHPDSVTAELALEALS